MDHLPKVLVIVDLLSEAPQLSQGAVIESLVGQMFQHPGQHTAHYCMRSPFSLPGPHWSGEGLCEGQMTR